MAFVISLGFATEQAKEAFVEKALPKARGRQVDPPAVEGEAEGLHRIAVAVTSQSAARDLCHLLVSFLSHDKSARIDVAWTGMDGQRHVGEVTGGAARDAEILAVRLGAAAKAQMDHEKAAGEEPEASLPPLRSRES